MHLIVCYLEPLEGGYDKLETTIINSKEIHPTKAMRRGLGMEPEAARLYTEVTGHATYPVGFVVPLASPFLGCSPDRRVLEAGGEQGLLEMKNPDVDSVSECKYIVHCEDASLRLN